MCLFGMPVAPFAPAHAAQVDPPFGAVQSAMDAGRWPQADGLLRPYLVVHPNDTSALYLLATTLFHEDQPRPSLEIFTRAARLQPPTATQLRTVAEDYVLLNDYDDADHWALRAVRQDDADAESWYVLGRIRQTENRFGDAVRCFTESLGRKPDSVKAADNLGLAWEGLNQPDKAVESYRHALALQASAPHPSEQPFLNLGVLLANRNQPAEALHLLQQAARLSPSDPKIHEALGKLYLRQNQLPEAQAEFEQATRSDPGSAALHFQLGQVYRRENRNDLATAELNRARDLEAGSRH